MNRENSNFDSIRKFLSFHQNNSVLKDLIEASALESYILRFKNGSKIHIKKKNRGKFTEYCGGTVTDECIRRAKKSSNPTLRKRATFA